MPERPVQEFRLNFVSASVWENTTDTGGTRFKVTLTRLYNDGDGWKRTTSFDPADLPYAVKVLDQAHTWEAEERARRAKARQEDLDSPVAS